MVNSRGHSSDMKTTIEYSLDYSTYFVATRYLEIDFQLSANRFGSVGQCKPVRCTHTDSNLFTRIL